MCDCVFVGVARDTVDVEGVESEELTTPLNHAQYSPSVSHDEEDRINKENGEWVYIGLWHQIFEVYIFNGCP